MTDIETAIVWRLEGIPEGDIAALAEVLRPLAEDFREDRPEVAAILADLRDRRTDRRNAWTLCAAVIAHDAHLRGDVTTMLLAGFEVLAAWRQSNRGRKPKPKPAKPMDALDSLLSDVVTSGTPASFDAVFRHCAGLASAFDPVIADADADKKVLVCTLDPDSEILTDVTAQELSSRIHRLARCNRLHAQAMA